MPTLADMRTEVALYLNDSENYNSIIDSSIKGTIRWLEQVYTLKYMYQYRVGYNAVVAGVLYCPWFREWSVCHVQKIGVALPVTVLRMRTAPLAGVDHTLLQKTGAPTAFALQSFTSSVPNGHFIFTSGENLGYTVEVFPKPDQAYLYHWKGWAYSRLDTMVDNTTHPLFLIAPDLIRSGALARVAVAARDPELRALAGDEFRSLLDPFLLSQEVDLYSEIHIDFKLEYQGETGQEWTDYYAELGGDEK